MVKQGLRKLGEFLIALGADEAKRPAPPSPRDRLRRPRSHSEERIRRILERHRSSGSPFVAGAVHLLGMDDVQKAAGASAQAVAAEVYGVANRAIKAHLSEDDVYEQYDGERFIIGFASPEKADAERKTKQIAHGIRERLPKEVQSAKAVKIAHHVTEVDSATLDPDAPLVNVLAQSLEKVRSAAETAAQEWRRVLTRDARVAFGPVWHSKSRLVATFRCLFRDETGRAAMARLAALSAPDEIPSAVCDLDCVILSRAVEALHGLVRDGRETKLLVPVNYQTLDDKVSREQHGRLCRIIPEAYKESTAFEIHSVPADASMTRAIDAVQAIKPHGGSVLVDMGMDEKRIAQLSGRWLTGVSADIGTVDEKSNRLARFAILAKRLDLMTLVHGVGTMGLVNMATKAGIDYLDGGAVGPAMDAPKSPYRLNLDASRPIVGDLETSGSATPR